MVEDLFNNLNLLLKIRFRRRYQRKLKAGQADVITCQVQESTKSEIDLTLLLCSKISFKYKFTCNDFQDVKDIAIYTAPVHIMSPALINMLHLPTTERFIRALILYTEYYLQV